MTVHFLLLVVSLVLPLSISSSKSNTLEPGFISISGVLISSGVFSASFYPAGDNAYMFAIWFSTPTSSGNCTTVWMANRDFPVNGKRSELLLQKSGNLILIDARRSIAWSTDASTTTLSRTSLQLYDNGNLVLQNMENVTLWQSFDTDTLLSWQKLTRGAQLVSSRSPTNFSSGFYKLFFDNDNLLRLLYDGPDVSSTYWPNPGLISWEAGRVTYNSGRIASIDSLANLISSDNFTALSADYGVVIQRRLKLDSDGNFRLYSREDGSRDWIVSWQAESQPCLVHGICGPNSTCSYDSISGRKCCCMPGYKMRNTTDWSFWCEPEFNLPSGINYDKVEFIRLPHVEFYGYDGYYTNYTLEMGKKLSLVNCSCGSNTSLTTATEF